MGFVASVLCMIGFVLIHLFARHLKFLRKRPRSHFLSIAGGISVAYVFLHLLPELADFQESLKGEGILGFIEHHIYLLALLGLVLFYGLEKYVKSSHKGRREGSSLTHNPGVFWVHIGIFTLYNFSIGYLLVREEFTESLGPLAFFIALGVHFVTNDISLDEQHDRDYARYGRWLLATAIAVGWAAATFTDLHPFILSYLVALLAGGIILNVMNEELPEESESSFRAFFLGAVVYSLILIFI